MIDDLEIEEHIKSCLSIDTKALNLQMLNIYTFPEAITDCTSLETLDLSFNRLRKLPSSFGKLKNLKTIILDENDFSEIPKILFELESLEEIYLSINRIKSISTDINKLKNLRFLSLNSNQIEYIPDECFDVKSLRRLSLGNIQITELPVEIANLNELESLNLFENNLNKIPKELSKLSNLKFLDLENNKLKTISKKIIQMRTLKYLNLNGNHIRNYPKLILSNSDPKEILNFIAALNLTGEVDYLHECKLVMVGRGFTGKTSMVKKLTNPDYKLENKIKSTEGIDIVKWDLNDGKNTYSLNIWDFAGQEKYDATHQFFLTERSIYIFVTEARQESNYLDFDYWINIVQLLSKNSPIIVVQNKIDERQKQLPTSKYRQQYPSITEFINVSCSEGYEQTIDKLRLAIKDVVKSLPHIGDELPKQWVDVRKNLEEIKEDYIKYQYYLDICSKYGLNDIQADYLSKYLNDLGVIVHHIDDANLKELVILNSDWAVDGAYAVLDSKKVEENSGRFKIKDLQEIWKNDRYSKKRNELLKLMLSHELCFQLSEKSELLPPQYIVPELLNPNPPDHYKSIPERNSLRFTLKYDFMPSGILTRFIVKIHKKIEDEIFWKHGVVIKHERTRAKITEDIADKRIEVQLYGENKIELLAIIRDEFNKIHKSFYNIQGEELIPCTCSYCEEELDKTRMFFFNYDTLKNHQRNNRKFVVCDISSEDVSISKLIRGSILITNKEQKEISIFNYNDNRQKTVMKIKKQKAHQIINADIIQNCNIGLDPQKDAVPQLIETLVEKDQQEELFHAYEILKDPNSEETVKQNSLQKVQGFLIKHSEAIGQSAVGGLMIELGKMVFIG